MRKERASLNLRHTGFEITMEYASENFEVPGHYLNLGKEVRPRDTPETRMKTEALKL